MKYTRRLKLFLISMVLLVALMPIGTVLGEEGRPPSPVTPIFASETTSGAVISEFAPELSSMTLEGVVLPGVLQNGADRLVAMQYTDGSWGWPLLSPPTYGNILGPIGMGLGRVYQQSLDNTHLSALVKVGGYLLNKTNNFSPSDGYLAAKLDEIFGVTIFVEHVTTNFYGPLAAGTYDRNGAGTLYDTAGYVNLIRTNRSGTQANLAAWDIGMGLVGASMSGASTAEWIAGVKAEIDELNGDGSEYYDVIGLAGAVYGLAFVGEDFDPTAGEHAAASNLADLAAILVGYQLSNGGFTWTATATTVGTDEAIQETAYALLALQELDRATYTPQIKRAAAYMRSVQLGTGGWEGNVGSGENNEVTAEALWALSLAFDELNVRSALGYDGDITELSEFSNTGGSFDRMSTTLSVGDTDLDQQVKSILHFNTSAIPDNAVITRVTMRLKPESITGDNPYDTHGYLVVDIKGPFFGASQNLQTDDFQAVEDMPVACTMFQTGVDWHMCIVKGTAYQYINRDGITQFRMRFQTSDNDDMSADLVNYYSGDVLTANFRPIMMVEFYVP